MLISYVIIREINSSKSGNGFRTYTEVTKDFQAFSLLSPPKVDDTKSSSSGIASSAANASAMLKDEIYELKASLLHYTSGR